MHHRLVANLVELSALLRKHRHPWPKWAEEVDNARKLLEVLDMPLKELLDKLESDKAAAIQSAKDAAAKELSDLTAAGKILSDTDAAKIKEGGSVIDAADTAALAADLAKNGLGPDGKPLPHA